MMTARKDRRKEQRIEKSVAPAGFGECKDCLRDIPTGGKCDGRCPECRERFEIRIIEHQGRVKEMEPSNFSPVYSPEQLARIERHWQAIAERAETEHSNGA